MNGKLILGSAILLALGACSTRDEGNGSTVISVDKNKVNEGLGDAGNALKDAGNEVKNAADKAGPAITNAADKAGDAVSNAAEKTGNAADRAADKTKNAVDNTHVQITTHKQEERKH